MGFFAPPRPASPPPPPTVDDEAVEEARRKELLARRNRLGRASTILTSGQGASGANVNRKSLLGE